MGRGTDGNAQTMTKQPFSEDEALDNFFRILDEELDEMPDEEVIRLMREIEGDEKAALADFDRRMIGFALPPRIPEQEPTDKEFDAPLDDEVNSFARELKVDEKGVVANLDGFMISSALPPSIPVRWQSSTSFSWGSVTSRSSPGIEMLRTVARRAMVVGACAGWVLLCFFAHAIFSDPRRTGPVLSDAQNQSQLSSVVQLGAIETRPRPEPATSGLSLPPPMPSDNADAGDFQKHMKSTMERMRIENQSDLKTVMSRVQRRGDALAETRLAIAYENGWTGLKRDKKRAMAHYERAALNGDNFAQLRLAYLYENEPLGDSLVNRSRAFRLYRMAAANGNRFAEVRAVYIGSQLYPLADASGTR